MPWRAVNSPGDNRCTALVLNAGSNRETVYSRYVEGEMTTDVAVEH